jgi:fructose-1,6-bisphosphatase I
MDKVDKFVISSTDPVTLTRHLITSQKEHKEASGDFTMLLTAIQTACKYISSKVRKAGIANLYGATGTGNATGDDQKKLDVLANEVFINVLRSSQKCSVLASEEEDAAIFVDIEHGKYVVAFDPLDGSSNIDVNISIGSIFGIWKKITSEPKGTLEDLMQPGSSLAAAGYCLYGSSTQLVLCMSDSPVNGYTLDPSLGEFILTHPNMQVPPKGAIYSINEGNASTWDATIKQYVNSKKFPEKDSGKKPFSLRYVGSMVADVHRTLIYGGIFMYPGDSKNPDGKLRVLYECFPMAFVIEKAGGKASTGMKRILDIIPKKIHERCPVILGSKEDVEEVDKLYLSNKKNN